MGSSPIASTLLGHLRMDGGPELGRSTRSWRTARRAARFQPQLMSAPAPPDRAPSDLASGYKNRDPGPVDTTRERSQSR